MGCPVSYQFVNPEVRYFQNSIQNSSNEKATKGKERQKRAGCNYLRTCENCVEAAFDGAGYFPIQNLLNI
jgi:hypothetical protein